MDGWLSARTVKTISIQKYNKGVNKNKVLHLTKPSAAYTDVKLSLLLEVFSPYTVFFIANNK